MAHIGHFDGKSRMSAKPMKLKAGKKDEGSAKPKTHMVKPKNATGLKRKGK
jgi:hypothetical protein